MRAVGWQACGMQELPLAFVEQSVSFAVLEQSGSPSTAVQLLRHPALVVFWPARAIIQVSIQSVCAPRTPLRSLSCLLLCSCFLCLPPLVLPVLAQAFTPSAARSGF
jgi:hypothetical protein